MDLNSKKGSLFDYVLYVVFLVVAGLAFIQISSNRNFVKEDTMAIEDIKSEIGNIVNEYRIHYLDEYFILKEKVELYDIVLEDSMDEYFNSRTNFMNFTSFDEINSTELKQMVFKNQFLLYNDSYILSFENNDVFFISKSPFILG